MIVKVVEERCTGCGACVDACPQELIEMRDGKAFVKSDCYGCEACTWACGHEALVRDEEARLPAF